MSNLRERKQRVEQKCDAYTIGMNLMSTGPQQKSLKNMNCKLLLTYFPTFPFSKENTHVDKTRWEGEQVKKRNTTILQIPE